MRSAIIYYRVSTVQQGISGLGLDAQRHAVQAFLRYRAYNVIAEFIEVESGKKSNRSKLTLALQQCRAYGATLLIAKIDRLSRSVAFISQLMESGVEFIAVDNPHAEKLMLHMLASFAEHERDQISNRTKAALKVAKQRGVELGKHGKYVLSKENKHKALEFARTMRPVINELHTNGITSVRKITKELNRRRIRTSAGGKWYASTVHRLLQRLKSLEDNNPSNE